MWQVIVNVDYPVDIVLFQLVRMSSSLSYSCRIGGILNITTKWSKINQLMIKPFIIFFYIYYTAKLAKLIIETRIYYYHLIWKNIYFSLKQVIHKIYINQRKVLAPGCSKLYKELYHQQSSLRSHYSSILGPPKVDIQWIM